MIYWKKAPRVAFCVASNRRSASATQPIPAITASPLPAHNNGTQHRPPALLRPRLHQVHIKSASGLHQVRIRTPAVQPIPAMASPLPAQNTGAQHRPPALLWPRLHQVCTRSASSHQVCISPAVLQCPVCSPQTPLATSAPRSSPHFIGTVPQHWALHWAPNCVIIMRVDHLMKLGRFSEQVAPLTPCLPSRPRLSSRLGPSPSDHS